MQNFTQTVLFKNLSAVFVFVVLVTSLATVVLDHFLQIKSDSFIIGLLYTGVGYIFNQLGAYQGANTALLSGQAVVNSLPVNASSIQAIQANTQATQANTQAVVADNQTKITPKGA